MKKTIITILAVLIGVFAILVATRPTQFKITRSTTIMAPVPIVFSQVNDFHKWADWSPWAPLDPHAKNSFEGTSAGMGAIFSWDGNKNVGKGRMTILESFPQKRIRIQLEFEKPMKTVDISEFSFIDEGNKTTVIWTLSGKNNFIAKTFNVFVNCDKLVGGQFEKGLASLKRLSEADPESTRNTP